MAKAKRNLRIKVDGLSVPRLHLEQYFGMWAVHPETFGELYRKVQAMDLAEHVAQSVARDPTFEPEARRARQETPGAGDQAVVAVITIEGTLTKRGSSFSDAGSLVEARRQVRTAARDPEVTGIVLKIDSPGGTVSGTKDLADEVARASAKKPIVAFVEDFAASAAYWVASQADKVYVNNLTAEVGSIGTFVALYDFSKAFQKEGVEPVLISSGGVKGAGMPGLEVSDEVREHLQEQVDGVQREFNAAIAGGRNLTEKAVRDLADGRIHLPAKAQKLGLIDGVRTFDEVLSEVVTLAHERRNRSSGARAQVESQEDHTMSNENKPEAASYEDIVACCPGADDDHAFVCSQLAKKATLDQAQTAWMEHLRENASAEKKRADEAEAKAKTEPSRPKVGVTGIPEGRGDGASSADKSDAVDRWNARVQELVKTGMSKAAAIRSICVSDKDLQREYVAARRLPLSRRETSAV